MATDSKPPELVKQVAQALERAKAQLDELRRAVEENNELARRNAQAQFLVRERDRALRDLGHALWEGIRRGEVKLPPSLSGPARAVLEAEKRLEAQAREINLLLAEGAEVAERLRARRAPKPVKSTVARAQKKR